MLTFLIYSLLIILLEQTQGKGCKNKLVLGKSVFSVTIKLKKTSEQKKHEVDEKISKKVIMQSWALADSSVARRWAQSRMALGSMTSAAGMTSVHIQKKP